MVDEQSDQGEVKEARRSRSVRMRSAARLAAVQTLFQIKASERVATEVVPSFRTHFLPALLKDFGIESMDENHYTQVVFATLEKQQAIDANLTPLFKDGWTIERMSTVDLSALRSAYTELDALGHIPARTVIDEYTAITEACGGDYAFVNALLDKLARSLRKSEMDA